VCFLRTLSLRGLFQKCFLFLRTSGKRPFLGSVIFLGEGTGVPFPPKMAQQPASFPAAAYRHEFSRFPLSPLFRNNYRGYPKPFSVTSPSFSMRAFFSFFPSLDKCKAARSNILCALLHCGSIDHCGGLRPSIPACQGSVDSSMRWNWRRSKTPQKFISFPSLTSGQRGTRDEACCLGAFLPTASNARG